MNQRRQASIEQCAELFLSPLTRLPIDIREICTENGIRLVESEPLGAVSGVSIVENGVKTIFVNASHLATRRRFSIAHELGHLTLHVSGDTVHSSGPVVFYRDAKSAAGTHREEVEANHFAACLLMPKRLLEASLKGLSTIDDEVLKQLARNFEVSDAALSIRLARLGLIS